MVEFINSYLAPQLVGQDPYHINRIKNRMRLAFGFGSVKGGLGNLFRSAWSAYDIAIWDIKGQHVGKPVHELLGGTTLQAWVDVPQR